MQENINAFLRVLDAKDNSTGGGTASSVAGAMAAGLTAMVARLSMDKKDLAPSPEKGCSYDYIGYAAKALGGFLAQKLKDYYFPGKQGFKKGKN